MKEEVKEIYHTIKQALERLYKINCKKLKCEDCPFSGLDMGCGDLIGQFIEGEE